MEELLTSPWRFGPAWLLIVAGLALIERGARRWRRLPADLRDPARALAIARSGRVILLGLGVVALGAAWLLSIGALVGLALIFIGEEMLETSTMIFALRRT